MAIQLSVAVRNALLDSIETTVGTSAILKVFGGTIPATCATADANATPLAVLTLPSDYMSAAASGTKDKLGTWQDASADNAGTATHFRLYNSAGTVCGLQGTVTATGGGGDMTVDNTSFAAGQQFTVTAFTLTAPGA